MIRSPRARHRLGAFDRLEDRCTPALLTVTTLDDSGPGSLREALAMANAATDADTIQFAPGLTGGGGGVTTSGILLTTVGDTTAGPSALAVTTPVTVRGTGQALRTYFNPPPD